MDGFVTPYLHLSNVLTTEDVQFLREACKRHLAREGMPCYVLINDLDSETCVKITRALERQIGEPVYYLNDFYIYTDATFKTNWHIDSELFSFDRAVNAWILLSPDYVDDPLGLIASLNDSPERTFHGAKIEGDRCVFGNYCTGQRTQRSTAIIETERIRTPRIKLGDILVINPKLFHKTNIDDPKHAIALKFVRKSPTGFLAANQVDPHLWPEVRIFNQLVRNARVWEDVVDGIRRALMSDTGRDVLSKGFLPEHFDLFRRMANAL